ncbi:LuxR family transcriptional regulator [Acidobacteria bacterium Mor1]|nr:LuxR family transcriptional regulator [Acidobacteria bacterium Mor1]
MRLILADDHTLVRAGIRSLLEAIPEVAVVAEASDGHGALELIEKYRPELALLDVTMPGLNGLEVAERARKSSPSTRTLVLSMHAGEEYVARALRVGVAGYLLKDAAAAELEIAIRAIARGDRYLSPAISTQVVDGFLRASEPAADPLAGLTARQRETLQMIAEGHSTRQIAETLGVSVKTVETHRAQLMDRLDIHDLAGLVRFAVRVGLVSPDA